VTPHIELQDELVAHSRQPSGRPRHWRSAVEGFERDLPSIAAPNIVLASAAARTRCDFALTGAGVQPGDIVLRFPTHLSRPQRRFPSRSTSDFVDVDARTYTMDPFEMRPVHGNEVRARQPHGRYVHRTLGKPVTAMIPFTCTGRPRNMDPILELADRLVSS